MSLLGRPTDRSIALSVLANVGTEVYVEYSTASGVYTANSPVSALASSPTTTIEADGAAANTRYFYRRAIDCRASRHAVPSPSAPSGRSAQLEVPSRSGGDSHPERAGRCFNVDLYALNMRNVASERPDFYMALGDDFSVEPLLDRGTWSAGTIGQLYATQRGWFGLVGHSSSVFLVNGNRAGRTVSG